ncbi:RbsD/FucU family protein [Herbiconiux sp. L3-i23]|uniref:RbsD/FucU family protein n=1 Tax=Herbiconiux sp. L3-i23 TaxID=2905871 RepID=UPI0020701E4C|nr:RbsD/FucU domain-containing protein [Herbiconiux sp. L3-i23]BDI21554.1 RbsD or FucU transporter [Herbiconiux sp. L3-i23]
MLIGIDPLLSGELLKLLDEMGHGDDLLIVDRNFPAYQSGNPVVHLGEVTVTRAVEAVLSVFPLDTFVDQPLGRMEAQDDASIVLEAHTEVLELARKAHSASLEFEVIPRFEFYERARGAFAIVKTLETRPYGCFVLKKGVV